MQKLLNYNSFNYSNQMKNSKYSQPYLYTQKKTISLLYKDCCKSNSSFSDSSDWGNAHLFFTYWMSIIPDCLANAIPNRPFVFSGSPNTTIVITLKAKEEGFFKWRQNEWKWKPLWPVYQSPMCTEHFKSLLIGNYN